MGISSDAGVEEAKSIGVGSFRLRWWGFVEKISDARPEVVELPIRPISLFVVHLQIWGLIGALSTGQLAFQSKLDSSFALHIPFQC